MTTGPVAAIEVVVGATVVGVDVDADVTDVDVVPASRASWSPPPPLHAARASRPRAVSTRRTLLVSPHGPARDARAPAGRDLRPAAGDRPGRRGRGIRRLLPVRPPHALRPGGPGSRTYRLLDHP